MAEPTNQKQHKVPQVYLKKFGYQNGNNQWMISVLKKGLKFTQQKSIKSFTIETNVFDIDSDDPRIPRMFETLNSELENEYNNIISELDNNQSLSDKGYAFLLQLTSNLICRSDYWRDWVFGMLNHENKENWLRIILGHHCKDYGEFKELDSKPHFRILADSPPEEVINRVLLFFTDHLMHRLWHYDIVFIKSQDGKPWFTSTNPIVMHLRTQKNEIFNKDSEIYFPLSPDYLAYLHYGKSDDKENPLRKAERNSMINADDEQNESLQKIIMANPSDYILIAGEFKYRVGE